MWELKTARDLTANRTYVTRGDYHASARKVTGQPIANDSAVVFPARPLWAYPPGKEDKPVTLTLDTPVYILTCTCNGMSFICNRWTFTGQCSCVHIPLPKEN